MFFQKCRQSEQLFGRIKEYCDEKMKQVAERDNFFVCMSHDIRNPVQSMLGSLEIITPIMNADAKVKKFVEICKTSSETVLNLVTNILDISKIQAGKMEISIYSGNTKELTEKTVNVYKQKAENKGIKLRFIEGLEVPPAIDTDHNKFSQILNNLISNGIKFTYRGEVAIQLEWKPIYEEKKKRLSNVPFDSINEPDHHRINKKYIMNRRATSTKIKSPSRSKSKSPRKDPRKCKKGIICLKVSDTGIGISQQNMQRLFQPFSQANADISRYSYFYTFLKAIWRHWFRSLYHKEYHYFVEWHNFGI
jgi:signal transduction histidine kinase